ncbi:hypothetical protein LCGC14_0564910 [marine sediment metagenome]|uniref:Uncharacterized protein n=1 Tax=marine sediment metagenome TaxID=412755 RepID=A0A0F9UU52_9ZZZZ
MSLTSTSASNPFAAEFAVETVNNGSASKRVFGNQSVVLRYVGMTAGVGEVNYVKLYEDGEPTVGTDAPDFIFEIDASAETERICVSGHTGADFSTAAVQEAGTGGTTAPTNALVTRLIAGPV